MKLDAWWWIGLATAALLGSALGACVTRHWLSRRHARALKQAVEAAKRESAATMERLRTAYTAVRLEQQQQRATLPRALATASLAQRAAIQRLEDELRFARAELGRCRPATFGAAEFFEDGDAPDHGFAPTRPFDGDH